MPLDHIFLVSWGCFEFKLFGQPEYAYHYTIHMLLSWKCFEKQFFLIQSKLNTWEKKTPQFYMAQAQLNGRKRCLKAMVSFAKESKTLRFPSIGIMPKLSKSSYNYDKRKQASQSNLQSYSTICFNTN